MQIHRLTRHHKYFPKQLMRLDQPPQELYAVGNLMLLTYVDNLAVVGSRAVSNYGREVTTQLVTELAWSSIVIISGLALGVDSLAHRAALEAKGSTIAVLPSGIENFYPASHQRLADQIIRQHGLIISEYPGSLQPQKFHFIARNRIIAGLAQATLVTEAAQKSGSLHTAQFALEQGRDVMAVPGSIYSPTSVGTHNLIDQGAKLVQTSQDILEILRAGVGKPAAKGDNVEEQAIIDLIRLGVNTNQAMHDKTDMSIQLFSQTLTMLELTDKAKQSAGQWSLL